MAIIHNGIIRNYQALKTELAARGHVFRSQTDSEVIAHLIEEERRVGQTGTLSCPPSGRRRGSRGSTPSSRSSPTGTTSWWGPGTRPPCWWAYPQEMNFFASDALAFVEYTDRVVYLRNMEVAALTLGGLEVFDMDGEKVREEETRVAWSLSDATKLGYSHYTLKEINDQPFTLQAALKQDPRDLASFLGTLNDGRGSLFMTAAGSSYHAALIMKHRLNREAKVRVDVTLYRGVQGTVRVHRRRFRPCGLQPERGDRGRPRGGQACEGTRLEDTLARERPRLVPGEGERRLSHAQLRAGGRCGRDQELLLPGHALEPHRGQAPGRGHRGRREGRLAARRLAAWRRPRSRP